MDNLNELRIPTDRVPPEILSMLREIGLKEQLGSSTSTSAASSLSLSSLSQSAQTISVNSRNHDEVDNFGITNVSSSSVVHVIHGDVTPRCKSAHAPQESDVVSVFAKGRSTPPKEFSPFPQQNPFKFTRLERSQTQDSEVVSLFTARQCTTPTKDSAGHSQSSPQPGFASQLSPNQQYFRDYRHVLTSTPSSQQSTPLKTISGFDEDEEDQRPPPNVTPTKSTIRPESCKSPSMCSESTSSLMPPTTPSSPHSIRSRSPMSQSASCSNVSSHPDDECVVRVFPPRSVTPTPETSGQQMLTPPETPESEGSKCRQTVAEVFTFDELTCAKERFRQNCEQLRLIQQDQFEPQYHTPPKRNASSTPRPLHLSSPSTPSYRRQEVPRSPSFLPPSSRRVSPVDPRGFDRFEGSSGISSPQSKKKDMPGSPAPNHQQQASTSQRLSLEDYGTQPRRDSLSPKIPKKRLDFEEDRDCSGGSSSVVSGVSPQQPQTPRSLQRSYETGTSPYSPRPGSSSSASDSVFMFPACGGPRAPPNTPSKAASYPGIADFLDRMASLAARHGGLDVDGDDDRASVYGATNRSLSFDSGIDFQTRMALLTGRYTIKRKRPDDETEAAQCTCSVMRQDFLQMAENAFRKVRRRDSSPQDFDRFTNELLQTNEILRESMELMKHIRDICDHRVLNDSWRPRW